MGQFVFWPIEAVDEGRSFDKNIEEFVEKLVDS